MGVLIAPVPPLLLASRGNFEGAQGNSIMHAVDPSLEQSGECAWTPWPSPNTQETCLSRDPLQATYDPA